MPALPPLPSPDPQPPVGLPRGRHWAVWKPQRDYRARREVPSQRGRVQTTRKSILPHRRWAVSRCTPAPPAAARSGECSCGLPAAGEALMEPGSAAGRVICNGFSIPVNISSPESRERDRDSAGRRALVKPVALQFSSREGWGLTLFLLSSLQAEPQGEWGSGLGLLCFTSESDGLL